MVQLRVPYLKNGRTPQPVDAGDGCTIRLLCNAFLTSKRNRIDAGELSPRSFEDYYQVCELLIEHFGKDRSVDDLRPEDFARLRRAMAKRWGPVRLKNTITRVRMVFKFAFDERLIKQSVIYGQSFATPSARTLRKSRNEAGQRMFESEELRRILDGADPVIKGMTLLGVNCGFGNTDVSSLPQSAVNLDTGWIDYPRPKTEIHRRIPLWPETVDALADAIVVRPEPKDKADADLFFLTVRGRRWVRLTPTKADERRYARLDQIGTRFGALLKQLGMNSRHRRGFYTLRHVAETIGGESKDQVAVNAIMGHVDRSMAATYRERISDDRLRAVVNVVRAWLWPAGK